MKEVILLATGGIVGAAIMYAALRNARKAVKAERDMAGAAISRERAESNALRTRITAYAVRNEQMRACAEANLAYQEGYAAGRNDHMRELGASGYTVVDKGI